MSGKKGADWYEESDRDKMNMLESCRRGNLSEVVKYVNNIGVNVDEEDDDGVTALQIAAAKGHRSLVEFLVRKGAGLDRANYAGMTPFLHACREGHQDIVTLLANQGADIHATSGLGVSAMALACAGRHLTVVRTLKGLNVGLDPNQQQQTAAGRNFHQIAPSAYMVAFFQMDIQICGFLKQQSFQLNADVWHEKIRALDGLDVLRLGHLLRMPEMLMRLNYAESSGDGTLRRQEAEKRDIRLALQQGEEQLLEQMLRDGQVPTSLQDGLSPLMFAAVSGQTRIAELLLKTGRGGALDAQENVLGMTALMFAIVAGEEAMVQLLLRHGANPRLLSTTRESFSALDLALFADISRDCVRQLCAQWLAKGSGQSGQNSSRKTGDKSGGAEERQMVRQSPAPARGAITPARLRRAIESIGKNLGLAGDDSGWGVGLEMAPIVGEGRPRLELAAQSALLHGPARFVLAEHILRGDARPPGAKKSSADHLVLLARQMAISWMTKGHALKPIPTGVGQKMFVAGGETETDGLYSAALRNADRELRKARHQRFEPVKKAPKVVLTPKMVRTAGQKEKVQKSPLLVDSSRIMRKAPHRRAASGSSHQSLTAQPDSPGSPGSALFRNQQPHFPAPLTKELVQSKLRELKLDKQFVEYFGAEEVDELTFAGLREEEVRQVLARHGECQHSPELGQRFVSLIKEIKRCTASSELL